MANLMITTACNFRCDYCFGAEIIGPGKSPRHMSWTTYLALLDWIERADVPRLDIHLMGGEPTTNPAFARMFRELRRRGRRTVVFSNAAVPLREEIYRESAQLGVEWIVNVNAPDTYRPGAFDVLRRNLGALGAQASVTLNVTRRDTPFRHALELIADHDLARRLKIGVALPTLEHKNVFVCREDFGPVAERVMELAGAAGEAGVAVEFECGVPYCLFNAEQVARLGEVPISSCGSRLDITPDGCVINCLPLVRVAAIPFQRFAHYREACEWFRRALTPYRSIGVYSECLGCEHLEKGRCWACLAYGMGQLNRIAVPPPPAS